MKIILIEDEGIALRKMKKLLSEINTNIEIIAELESVQEAKEWFSTHSDSQIDLIFSDIQLSDGLSFEIFEENNNLLPIIFTTAYDEYALRAFKTNGVDYLLKPIQKEDLALSINNFEAKKKVYSKTQLSDIQQLIAQYSQPKNLNPSFLSYQKDKIIPVVADTISYFFTLNQIVYAVVGNAKYMLEETLEEVETRLSPTYFFRANRQFIVQKRFVSNVELYFNNRLIVHLKEKTHEEIIISREKASNFKQWLMGG